MTSEDVPALVEDYVPGDMVLLHPWQLPVKYHGNVYARVYKQEPTRLTVKTRLISGDNGFPATTLIIELGSQFRPTKVPPSEPNGNKTGLYLYRAVMTNIGLQYRHGQVVGYENKPPMLNIMTRDGIVKYRPDQVLEVAGPIGVLFFSQSFMRESVTVDDMLVGHATVLKRIQDCDMSNESLDILPTVFANVCDVPIEPVSWINPITGSRCLCRPLHAALFYRMESNWDNAPPALVSLVGL